jgi:uncharacterized protein YukE
VSFLRDALNQLMGNPEEIQANVEATKARAAELRVLAEDHKNGLATFDGWSGASSERFKASMDGMSQELDELASAVETKAKIVAIMGMLVTVLRDIVRDLIAQLLGSLIGGALIAAATMIPTFGASIPAFIGFAVGKAVALGTNIASRVARVVAALARQMKRIGDLDGIMAKISKGWERFENSADVAEIGWEGYKAAKGVDKKIDEAVAGNDAGGSAGTGSTPKAASVHEGTVQAHSFAAPAATSQLRAFEAPHAQVEAVEAHTATAQLRAFEAPTAPSQPHAFETPHARVEQQVEALRPMQAPARVDAGFPMASDSTVASGVSMTPGTPVHEAVQPMQAREMHQVVEANQAEQLQQFTPFETAVRPQPFEALEPTRENLNPLQSHTAYAGFEAPAEPAAAYEAVAQSGGAPVQPLRPAVSHERPTRPSE